MIYSKKRNIVFIYTLSLFFLLISCSENGNVKNNKYNYETFESELFNLKVYTLKNGLKLFLVPNHDIPRIRTAITVKAGSKHEPNHTSGLAHYLEHLLFKGTDKLGTLNFEEEAPILKKIEDLFEKHRQTNKPIEKKKIRFKIDSLSYEASKYGLPAEFNDLMSQMGISFMNAFTSFDVTNYMSDISSNQIEKWIALESERFRNPQFRNFNTELKTVYEESNYYIDDDIAHFKAFELVFPKHQYSKLPGGKVEHLENPSIKETKEYFQNFYVPNNMAITLIGDFDPDKVVGLIEKNFGYMKRKELPKPKVIIEDLITAPIEKYVTSPNGNKIKIIYRFKGANSDEALKVKLIDRLMMNGQAGIFDLNIVKSQKAGSIRIHPEYMYEHSVHIIDAIPKQGQSLKDLKNVIITEIDRLRTGNFPDWLLNAAVNDLKQQFMQNIVPNRGKANFLFKSWTFDIPIEKQLSEIENLKKITKKDIMKFVEKHYTNKHAVVYTKIGELDASVKKLSSASVTPILLNKEKASSFKAKIQEIKTTSITPSFLNYNKDIQNFKLSNGTQVSLVKNKENKLFTLNIVFDLSQNNDKLLDLAVDYLNLAGTDKFTPTEIAQEFYKIGCNFNISTNTWKTSIFLTGLSENMEKGLELLNHSLLNVKQDEKVLISLKQSILGNRLNQKKSKRSIFRHGANYVIYEEGKSTLKNVFSEEELKGIKTSELVDKLRNLMNNKHRILYYGTLQKEELKNVFNTKLDREQTLVEVKRNSEFSYRKNTTNQIYVVGAKGKQIDIRFTSNLNNFDLSILPMVQLFNQYYNDLIFGEIRESRGLAYTAYGGISIPNYTNRTYLFHSTLSVQYDKYIEAIEATYNLIRKMPFDRASFEKAKNSLLEKMQSERIINFNLLSDYEKAQNRGVNYDLRKATFESLQKVTLENFQNFYNKYIKDKFMNILIVGDVDLSSADEEKLKKYGQINRLSLKDIFGY